MWYTYNSHIKRAEQFARLHMPNLHLYRNIYQEVGGASYCKRTRIYHFCATNSYIHRFIPSFCSLSWSHLTWMEYLYWLVLQCFRDQVRDTRSPTWARRIQNHVWITWSVTRVIAYAVTLRGGKQYFTVGDRVNGLATRSCTSWALASTERPADHSRHWVARSCFM